MAELVLDRVQLLLRENREGGDPRPRTRPRRLFVDPGGRIRLGDAVPEGEGPGLADVPQALFA